MASENCNYGYDSGLNVSQNTYDGDDPLEKVVVDRPYFFNRHWNWALAQATEMFRPIAERMGENGVRFTPQNSELVIDSRKTTDDNCQDLVHPSLGEYYGCNSQKAWHGNTLAPYTKPLSSTYLAEEWALAFVRNAQQHELSHQAIITLRQMISKDHQARRSLKYPSLSDAGYKAFDSVFERMDRELDNMDRAWFNSSTGRIEIDKKSDVWPKLDAAVDVYYDCIREGL